MSAIYCCHKCGGNLGDRHPALYGCSCISGWVRDWQEPTPLAEALAYQRDRTREWIELFIRQGREPDRIQFERDRLAAILKTMESLPV